MIFLLSLALAALFLWGCAKPLKQHPIPYYLAAAAISAVVLGCTLGGVRFPGWFQNWVWPIFSRSAFATALWAVVMWTGALPNGSKAIRFLMPIRGELSILAAILTLGHNAAYGKVYFLGITKLPSNQLAAAICSLVLICIMLPLFITSFKTVRKKMKGSSWKKLQRLAYGFYALLYVHIMLLTVPAPLEGRSGYLLSVLVYSVVFLGYAICRVLKAVARKSKQTTGLFRRQRRALACALLLSLILTGCLGCQAQTEAPEDGASQEEVLTEDQEEADEPPAEEEEDTPEAETAGTEEKPAQQAEQTQQTEKPAASTTTAAPSSNSKQSAASQTQTSSQTTTAQTPAQPAPAPEPVLTYKNGTFTGTGSGFNGPITVSVTIQNDVITGISVTSSSDDEPYLSDGKGVISRILSAQSANVNTVSGATYSSGGIIDAVKAALASAKN